MRKIFGITVLLATLIGLQARSVVGQGHLQTTPQLRYSVAFSTYLGYPLDQNAVLVASLDTNNEWAVTSLDAPLLVGNYDNFGTTQTGLSPSWSSDGQIFYATQSQGVAPTYDPRYGPLVTAFQAPDWSVKQTYDLSMEIPLEDAAPDAIQLVSISPDGHYGWINTYTSPTRSFVINLENGAIIKELDCAAAPAVWILNEVVGVNFSSCDAEAFVLNLSSGAQVKLTPTPQFPYQPIAYTPNGQYLPEWKAVLLGSGNVVGDVAMMRFDGTAGFNLGFGYKASLSPDGTSLLYVADSVINPTLVRVDLATGVPETLDEGIIGFASFTQNGDTLNYWKIGGEVNQKAITWVALPRNEPSNRIEQPVYDVDQQFDPNRAVFMPDMPRLAYQTYDATPNSRVVVYADNEIIFSTDAIDPEASFVLWPRLETPILGEWVWVLNTDTQQTAALNLRTLEWRTPPTEASSDGSQASFVSMSPDGEWWLYYVDEGNSSDQLMAYHPASGATTQLWYGEALMHNVQLLDGSPASQALLWWSPINAMTGAKSGQADQP